MKKAVVLGVAFLVVGGLVVLSLQSCQLKTLPQIELDYSHPEHGEGKLHMHPDCDPVALADPSAISCWPLARNF